MSNDNTVADKTAGVVDPTEAIEPETTTALAWSSDQADDEELSHPAAAGANRPVVAVAALAGVALALASVAAVVALMTPHAQPDRFTIRPAPIEQVPPPAPPKAPPAPAPPRVQAAPPIQQAAPPQAPPPDANQRFTDALKDDKPQTQGGSGLYPTQPAGTINSEAQSMCQDLANGGAIQPYIDGTLAKSPSLAPWQAAQVVHQAIQAYCPQYEK